MKNYRDTFKNKKATVMGLNPDGRGLKDVEFLASKGAEVVATDLKSPEELKESVRKLSDYSNVELVLGEHRLEDFRNKDFVIRAASAPLGSKYLQEAKKNDTPVHIDETLFLEFAPEVKTVGVTGTRGKSTVTHMIHKILKPTDKKAHLGGNIKSKALLPLLPRVNPGDFMVLELSSWQLQGFGDRKMSPDIAVFTNFFEDHLDYYAEDPSDPNSRKRGMERYFEDKAQIFRHQKEGDVLIAGKGVTDRLPENCSFRSVGPEDLPENYQLNVPGEHNRFNAAIAREVAKEIGIEESIIKDQLESFRGVEGRLEYLGYINGVEVYNDNNATTQDATVAAIEALSEHNPLTLLAGGSDKKLKFNKLTEAIKDKVDNLLLLEGSGTEKMKKALRDNNFDSWTEYEEFEKAVLEAVENTNEGGAFLFSPAAASFNMFENEHERCDRFKEIIEKI